MPGTYRYGLSGELDSSANWYKSQQIARERFEWQKKLDAINRQDTRDRAVLFRHDTRESGDKSKPTGLPYGQLRYRAPAG